MARTKASVGAKVSVVKSTKARAAAAPPPPSRAESGKAFSNSLAGCNPVCPRETPAWQLPITRFFPATPAPDTARVGEASASSSRRSRKNVIESDEETDMDTSALDKSIDLVPLDGEACHKIAEYFPLVEGKTDAREENKENVQVGAKRSLDEACGSASKKVKISV